MLPFALRRCSLALASETKHMPYQRTNSLSLLTLETRVAGVCQGRRHAEACAGRYLNTVTVRVVRLPAASRADATMLWLPRLAFFTFQR